MFQKSGEGASAAIAETLPVEILPGLLGNACLVIADMCLASAGQPLLCPLLLRSVWHHGPRCRLRAGAWPGAASAPADRTVLLRLFSMLLSAQLLTAFMSQIEQHRQDYILITSIVVLYNNSAVLSLPVDFCY